MNVPYLLYINMHLQVRRRCPCIHSNHRCSTLTTVQHSRSMEHQCHHSQHSRFNRPSMACHQGVMRSPQHTPRNKAAAITMKSEWERNHQPRECLLNRVFRRRSKKTSKLCVTSLCAGNSPVNGEFPAQIGQ